MSGFAKLVPKKCKALRDGTIVILDAEELVPGGRTRGGAWACLGRPRLPAKQPAHVPAAPARVGTRRTMHVHTCQFGSTRQAGQLSSTPPRTLPPAPCQATWSTCPTAIRCPPTSASCPATTCRSTTGDSFPWNTMYCLAWPLAATVYCSAQFCSWACYTSIHHVQLRLC